MNKPGVSPTITIRIPGDWAHPRDLLKRLPEGFQLGPETLVSPDGTEFEFSPMPPDGQFEQIFQTACRRRPGDDELAVLSRYTVNAGLSGPGGSLESALAIMQAGAAFVQAGGAGVFIDNSALAHGGQDWIAMSEDGGSDAISFAFVSIVAGRHEVYTMGMHVMGLPDLVVPSSDQDDRGELIVETVRYFCSTDRSIEVGHILADELGPRFQIVASEDGPAEVPGPMYNPYGRLKIMSLRDIAQGN